MNNRNPRRWLLVLVGLSAMLWGLFGCTGEAPRVALDAAVTNGQAPLEVPFDLSHSDIPSGIIVHYTLDFGDGTPPATGTDLGVVVHHTYENAGVFTATLTVTDGKGHQGTDSITITVSFAPPPVGTGVGMTAPDFTAHTTDGGEITLSDYRGQVVILEFWGAWCTPCKKSMPHLQDLYDQYHDQGLVVVAVSTDQDEQDTIDYLTANGYTDFISVWEPGGKHESSITKLYKVASPLVGIPRTFLIDRQGVIRYVGHPMDLDAQLIQGLL